MHCIWYVAEGGVQITHSCFVHADPINSNLTEYMIKWTVLPVNVNIMLHKIPLYVKKNYHFLHVFFKTKPLKIIDFFKKNVSFEFKPNKNYKKKFSCEN